MLKTKASQSAPTLPPQLRHNHTISQKRKENQLDVATAEEEDKVSTVRSEVES
jgi:hypothetical protein